MDIRYGKYVPMNRAHIHGFPNCISCIDLKSYFPKLKDENGDDVALHLIKFHMHAHKMRVQFPEDCLMKMFMATLEGNIRSWYEGFPFASIYSLKYFHSIFFEE